MKGKKFLALLLALVMTLALAACGPKDNGGSPGNDQPQTVDDGGVVEPIDEGEMGSSMFQKPGADVVLDHDEPDGGAYIQTTPKK